MVEPQREQRTLGRYEILAGLSTGGMAELYLAATQGPGGYRKFVAVKKILPDVATNERFVHMFQDEARITASLSHHAIAQVLELGDEGGELYLALDFVLGMDLARILRSLRKAGQLLPIGISARIVRDICLALDHAHRFVDASGQPSPVIHRDVTPKNVMLTFDGGVKVIDFGLALARGRMETTAAGTIKGTAAYMSPEQVYARPLDGRSDLYSAGAVLFELLTGQRLYSGKYDSEVLRQVAAGTPVSPQALNPSIPPALSKVVEKALSRDRGDRFPTGQEMARAIEDAARPELADPTLSAMFMRSTFRDRLSEVRAWMSSALGLPQQEKPAPEAELTEEQTIPRIELDPVGATVLAAGDDPAVLLEVQNTLRAAGHKVITVGFPERLPALIAEHRPAALLVTAGGTPDGHALARAVRQGTVKRNAPILMLSRTCTLADRAAALDAGADDLVRLPLDRDDLVARVRGHIRTYELLKSLGVRRLKPASTS